MNFRLITTLVIIAFTKVAISQNSGINNKNRVLKTPVNKQDNALSGKQP